MPHMPHVHDKLSKPKNHEKSTQQMVEEAVQLAKESRAEYDTSESKA